ncbi:MAG: hypothetical protein ACRCUE_07820 [Bosea sp. (in: a-proteobacteria)]
MTTTSMTRRGIVAAAAALTAAPVAIAATTATRSATTPIGALWAEAEALRIKLEVHRDAITEAAESGGISGWMRLGGEANAMGEARHAKLVAIMKAEPAADADLAIMAHVTLDDDFRRGAFNWAGEQLARAVVGFSTASVA